MRRDRKNQNDAGGLEESVGGRDLVEVGGDGGGRDEGSEGRSALIEGDGLRSGFRSMEAM